MRQFVTGAWLLAAVAGCKADNELDAPMPVATGPLAVDSALTLSPSHIDVPVEYDLGPALAWFEETLPRRIGDIEERRETPGNDRLSFAFSAERTPFQLRLNGTTATLSSVVTYGGRGWYNPPVLPTVSGSCGLDDTPPRVRITVRSTVTPTADWRLRARSSVTEIVPLTEASRDQCVVTFAQINVTERVLEAVRGVLEKELGKVDAQLALFDLRARVADVWSFLGTPVRLQDSLWLLMDPTAIRLNQVRNEGTTLHTSVGVTAFPHVVSGARPAPATRAIPRLERGAGGGSGMSLLSVGRISWDVLTGILQRELTGDTIQVAGRQLEIEDVTVMGLDDGRVAVGLTVSGAARGTAYLVGRPVFDPREAVLTMPDLEFDVSSRSLMVSGLAWLASGQVEEYLRTSLRISLASVLADGLTLMERELTRELATGVTLATTVTGGQVYRVRPRREALLVDAVAQGTTQMRIRLAPGRRVSQDSVGREP